MKDSSTRNVMRIISILFRANIVAILTILVLAFLGSLREAPASFNPPPPPKVKKTVKKVNPLQQKLKTIQLKNVDLKNSTLKETVDFLRNSAKENDPAKENKGVNFVIRGEIGEKVLSDIVLRDVSLENAVKAITMANGLDYRVEDFAVIIFQPKF